MSPNLRLQASAVAAIDSLVASSLRSVQSSGTNTTASTRAVGGIIHPGVIAARRTHASGEAVSFEAQWRLCVPVPPDGAWFLLR